LPAEHFAGLLLPLPTFPILPPLPRFFAAPPVALGCGFAPTPDCRSVLFSLRRTTYARPKTIPRCSRLKDVLLSPVHFRLHPGGACQHFSSLPYHHPLFPAYPFAPHPLLPLYLAYLGFTPQFTFIAHRHMGGTVPAIPPGALRRAGRLIRLLPAFVAAYRFVGVHSRQHRCLYRGAGTFAGTRGPRDGMTPGFYARNAGFAACTTARWRRCYAFLNTCTRTQRQLAAYACLTSPTNCLLAAHGSWTPAYSLRLPAIYLSGAF